MVVGDKGDEWELQLLAWCFIPLALQRSCGCKATASGWGLLLDGSRWFAIYRLLNIFRVAGRRDTLSLPTSLLVERDGFSPSSPSTHPSGLLQILASATLLCHCILTGTIPAVLSTCLCFVWSSSVLKAVQVPPCPGELWMCVYVCCYGMCHPCSIPGSSDTGC